MNTHPTTPDTTRPQARTIQSPAEPTQTATWTDDDVTVRTSGSLYRIFGNSLKAACANAAQQAAWHVKDRACRVSAARSRASVLVPMVLGLLVAAPAFAHEEHDGPDHNQINGVRVDLHANVDAYSVFGSGIRVEFAVVPNGFLLGNVHDELALGFGADLFFAPLDWGAVWYDGGPYAIPMAVLQWNFYLGDHWSVFPEAGLAGHASFDRSGWQDNRGHVHGWLYPEAELGIGARYHFNSHVALLMRASTPGGLQVGIVF